MEEMKPLVYMFFVVVFFIFCVLTYIVGMDAGRDEFVNKICQQTQYEFCQPTYVYKAKGKIK